MGGGFEGASVSEREMGLNIEKIAFAVVAIGFAYEKHPVVVIGFVALAS